MEAAVWVPWAAVLRCPCSAPAETRAAEYRSPWHPGNRAVAKTRRYTPAARRLPVGSGKRLHSPAIEPLSQCIQVRPFGHDVGKVSKDLLVCRHLTPGGDGEDFRRTLRRNAKLAVTPLR